MHNNGRDYWDAAVTLTPSAQKYHNAASITAPYNHTSIDITFFVSCHNEEVTVAETLTTIADAMTTIERSYEIIVMDDCSLDRSVQRVHDYMDNHPYMNIVLCTGKKRKRLAQNYVDAAFIGKGRYFWLVPGSNIESMETIVDVLRTLGEADIIMPYSLASLRDTTGRQLLTRTYTQMMNLLMRHRFNDYRGHPVHLRYNVMRWHSNTTGHSFQEELLCRLLDVGFTCKQVPYRRKGSQQNLPMSWPRFFSVFQTVMSIVLRRISYRVSRG